MVKKNVGTNQKRVKLISLREQIYNTLHLLKKWFIMCFWREVLRKRSTFLRKCGVTEFKTLSKVKYISTKMFLLFTQRNLMFSCFAFACLTCHQNNNNNNNATFSVMLLFCQLTFNF